MAIVKCGECGGKVSSKATTCPHCGCPVSEIKTSVFVTAKEKKTGRSSPMAELNIECLDDWRLASHTYKVFIDGKAFGKMEPGDVLFDDIAVGEHKIKVIDKSKDDEVVCRKKLIITEDGLMLTFSPRKWKLSVAGDEESESSKGYAFSLISLLCAICIAAAIVYFGVEFSKRLNSMSASVDSLQFLFGSGDNIITSAVDELKSRFIRLLLPWFLLSGFGAAIAVLGSILRSYIVTICATALEAASFAYIMYRDLSNEVFYLVVIFAVIQLIARDIADHAGDED